MTCEKCRDIVERKDVPHVVRKCAGCGRELHVRELGKHGIGIKIRDGDRFTIPKGWLKISADPRKSTAYMTRYGLTFFADMMFVDKLPQSRGQYSKQLERLFNESHQLLKSSELLSEVDFESEDSLFTASDLLKKKPTTIEWYALLTATFAATCDQAIEEGDAETAGWAAACTERSHAMLVFKQAFEEVVFMGHSARRIVDALNKWASNTKNGDEGFWQHTFTENPYVISQAFAAPVIFIQGNAYVGGTKIDRKDAKFVDFLFSSEMSNDAILVEIKTPTTKLLGGKYRGVYRPSVELSGATVQALGYRRQLGIELKSVAANHNLTFYNPRCMIIAGNGSAELKTPAHREAFELYRSSLKDVEIVT